ncbi:ABC transporter permease [Promicromonospora panici]|uniref:ABC transporter permease n=1 Tax=Promicromonospora panici TaxID=2219658 RepID=UPI001F5D0906|nr:ABC-2 family transporter protein [Promicromonospora panici]
MADVRRSMRAYRAVLASRARSQASYRASFRMDLVGALLVGIIEFTEIWVLYTASDQIGGFTLAQIMLVFGLADLAFSLADLVFGHCDNLPLYVRKGTLDVFFLRPQPVLAQLVTSDLSLRRIGRCLVGATALTVGLVVNDIDWGVGTIGLLVLSLACGFVIFAAQFVMAAGLQFFLINGAEMTNAFVYGGRYAATQPATVWPRALLVLFGGIFPVAFAAYLPVSTLLGVPSVAGLPVWLGWCAPVAALWAVCVAWLCWRWGLRHYRGAGG